MQITEYDFSVCVCKIVRVFPSATEVLRLYNTPKFDRIAFFLHPFPPPLLLLQIPEKDRWSVVGYSTADNYDLLSLAQKLEEQGLYQVMNGCVIILKGTVSHSVVSRVGRAPGGRAPAAVPVRTGKVLGGRRRRRGGGVVLLLNRGKEGRRGGTEANRLEGHVSLRKRVRYRSCFIKRESLAVMHKRSSNICSFLEYLFSSVVVSPFLKLFFA